MPIHVSVIHVMARHSLAPGEGGVTILWVKQRELKVKEVGWKLVEQNVQQLIKAGFMAELLCQSGNPEDKIVKMASQQHAALNVMGAQGLAAIVTGLSLGACRLGSCSMLTVPCSSFDKRWKVLRDYTKGWVP